MTYDELFSAAFAACSKESPGWIVAGALDVIYDHTRSALRDATRDELVAFLRSRKDPEGCARALQAINEAPSARWLVAMHGDVFVWTQFKVRLAGPGANN